MGSILHPNQADKGNYSSPDSYLQQQKSLQVPQTPDVSGGALARDQKNVSDSYFQDLASYLNNKDEAK